LYSSSDLAFIIPTKNRPKEVKRHLQSLVKQDCDIGRIIIVASGDDIEKIVMKFSDMLPVEYYRSDPGQIRQRNLGISLLNESTKLVATMDDDVTYEKNAITNMIHFWNNTNNTTAGVGFNVINMKKHKHSLVKGMLGLSVLDQGKILESGINTSITNINNNIRSEWLNGGATVWKKEILLRFKHDEVKSKWATNEDTIYSYPIGKIYPLFVYCDAKVRVESFPESKINLKDIIFIGKSTVYWRILFVLKNDDLSLLKCYLTILITIIYILIYGIVMLKINKIISGIGFIYGVLNSLYNKVREPRDIILLIEK
jgi:glycosyltransferase involved in cell wall biosynthesis